MLDKIHQDESFVIFIVWQSCSSVCGGGAVLALLRVYGG